MVSLTRRKVFDSPLLLLLACIVFLLDSCDSPESGPAVFADGEHHPDLGQTPGAGDLSFDQVAAESPGSKVAGEDVLPGSDRGEAFVGDTQGPGGFLDPCEENSDCESGFCIAHAGQLVCSRLCLDECPVGWKCKQVAGSGTDAVFICVSDFWALCRPCKDNADCASPFGDAEQCIVYSQDGRFCGADCVTDSDCPEGYACLLSTAADGQQSLQCVNSSGECECTPWYVAAHLSTICERTSESGTCPGSRVCTADGLSPCNAKPVKDCGVNGNGVCEPFFGETIETAPCDCKVCGDGVCSPCETPKQCPEDCCRAPGGNPSLCGDGHCAGPACNETAQTCPHDCAAVCGNGKCEPGESCDVKEGFIQCPEDCCWQTCGDGVCTPKDLEGGKTCPADCLPNCGDCKCDPDAGETWFTCPIDCGSCGDGVCSACPNVGDKAVKTENGPDDKPVEKVIILCPEDCCNPAFEVCDGVDNDCDGQTDEKDAVGCQEYFADGDQDGFGAGEALCLCENHPAYPYYSTQVVGDCDDANADIYPGATEVCNGKDDDCDGLTDEDGCSDNNPCTEGDVCIAGQCIPGKPKDCSFLSDQCNEGVCEQVLGTCVAKAKDDGTPCDDGIATSCNDACYQGACKGIAGQCAPGSTKIEGGCGKCGQQQWVCGGDCQWRPGECKGEGACNPGTEKVEGVCGNCGQQKWICGGDCQWHKDSCVGQGECTPGQVQTQACGGGGCGTSYRTCENSCHWSGWSTCSLKPGMACFDGQTETRDCGSGCGTQSRSCQGCQWTSYGQCVLKPGNACFSGETLNNCALCEAGNTKCENCQWHSYCTNKGWKEYKGHCYKFFADGKPQGQADQDCSYRGGRLASICTVGERDFILNNVTNNQAWIGLFCDTAPCTDMSHWRWVGPDNCGGGTPYKNWASGQPSGDGKCGHQLDGGKWNDRPCDHLLGRVCETQGKPSNF